MILQQWMLRLSMLNSHSGDTLIMIGDRNMVYIIFLKEEVDRYYYIREQPFNLKGWGGSYCFFRSRIFFFATKTNIFLRHKVPSEYFFLPNSETEFFFQSHLPTENPPPPKKNPKQPPPPFLQIKWMFPKFMLSQELGTW